MGAGNARVIGIGVPCLDPVDQAFLVKPFKGWLNSIERRLFIAGNIAADILRILMRLLSERLHRQKLQLGHR